MPGKSKKNDNGKGEDVRYRGAQVLNALLRGRDGKFYYYNAIGIKNLHDDYEVLLKNGNYGEARELESDKIPKSRTWLNSVISCLVAESQQNGGGLARKLVEEFKDRGYDEHWLGLQQDPVYDRYIEKKNQEIETIV